ncbi:MAG: AraC family transcriptional regulator [Planctomycetota bacterium]
MDVSVGAERDGLRVRWGCLDRFDPGEWVRNRGITTWVLKFVVSGQATLSSLNSPGLTHDVGPDSVVWASSLADTDLLVGPDAPLRNYTLFVYGQETPHIFGQVFSTRIGCRPVAEPRLIESLFAEIYLEAQGKHTHRQDNCAALLRVLFNRIATHLERTPGYAGEARLYFQEAQAYIETNYASIHTIQDVAKYCGVTPQYLSRVFKAFADTSPHHYMTRLRIHHAQELLGRLPHPINQIAKAVGYDDAGLFTRNYKKATGESPRAYRDRIQGKKRRTRGTT